jgi:hypothetical protein
MIHICTFDSLAAGLEDLDFVDECRICLKTAKQQTSWVALRCIACGHQYSFDEGTRGIVTSQRRMLKLTRRQLGEKIGYKPSTIKKYEWTWPTKAYREKLNDLVREINATDNL